MPYSLRRTRDGAGDAGPMFLLLRWNEEENRVETKEQPEKPEVGWAVRVGSPYGRTYQMQDWWQTTPITEILEEGEGYMRFRTGNSEYEWKKF